MTVYKIRSAKPSEATTLSELAFISKAYWEYPQEWLEIWREDLTITPEMINNSITLVAEYNNEVVGFWCRPAEESLTPTVGFLFIHPDHMGKGIGKALFNAIKQEAVKCGIKYFTIEADPNAVPFYLKMGAEQIGEKASDVIPGRKLPILRFNIL